MKKKIAFFSVFPLEYGGGLEKYFIEISTELKKRFWGDIEEICIINLSNKFYENFCKLLNWTKLISLTPTYRIDTKEIEGSLWNDVMWKKVKLRDLWKNFSEYDVIYTKNEILELFILNFINIKKELKLIAWVHTAPFYPWTWYKIKFRNYLYTWLFYKFISRKISIFHTINQENSTFLKNIFKNKRVIKIYNPFNFRDYELLKYKYIHTYINNWKYTIVWSGRFTEQKWIYDLIHIVWEINKEFYDSVEWVIMWDWELREELEKWIYGYKNIKYLWYVANKYIPSILSQCNLYISTSHWEWFPYNILEAQALWLPVISYDIAWCNDIIEDWKNWTLAKNKLDIIESIKQSILWKKEINLNQIKINIAKKFDIDIIYSQIYKIF